MNKTTSMTVFAALVYLACVVAFVSVLGLPAAYADNSEPAPERSAAVSVLNLGDGQETAADTPSVFSGQTGYIASGTCGTCTWTIDSAGELLIKPTVGEVGTLGDVKHAPWGNCKTITSMRFEGTVKTGEDIGGIFSGCPNLKSINFSGLDISNLRDMGWMLVDCPSLEFLDMSTLDVSNIEHMESMLASCDSLSEMILGSSFKFVPFDPPYDFPSYPGLVSPPTDPPYTGKWAGPNGESFKARDLEIYYDGATMVGTWRWETIPDLTWASVGAIPDQAYTGTGIKPKPEVKLGREVLDPGTDYELSYKDNVEPGTATVTVTGKGDYTGSKTVTFRITNPSVWVRLDGQRNGFVKGAGTRWDTMADIVTEGWSGTTGGTVVVARGDGKNNFRDALAACGVAGFFDAPVVTIDPTASSLTKRAADLLAKLKPSRIVVAGGPKAIPDSMVRKVEAAAGAKSGSAIRMAGNSSAQTSAALCADTAKRLGQKWSDTAFVATNASFRDALSAAPIAYRLHMPILLADGHDRIDDKVLHALDSVGIRKVILLGSEHAVTAGAALYLEDCGIEVVGRLEGVDASGRKTGVATSRAIADWGAKNGMSCNFMGVATSQSAPDALAGAALCGLHGGVIVLADDKSMLNADYPGTAATGTIKRGYVFGSEQYAVGKRTWDKLAASTR